MGWKISRLLTGAALLLATGTAQAEVAVVASIKPIHALVAGVMGDLGTPTLLVNGAASPHSYALKPSEARAVAAAQVVFRVSETLEAFLNQPLKNMAGNARVVDLAEASGVETLAYRTGALWDSGAGDQHEATEPNDAGHDAAHEEEEHDHGSVDQHVWLDPANARAMTDAIAATLSAVDPENAGAYAANAARQNGRLAALEQEIRADLAPLRDRPFVVFHDGYHYFEHRFGIEAAGAVTLNPEIQPGAARVRDVRARIVELGAICVFAEPQFRPRLIETLIEGTAAHAGVLDPLGADLAPGPEAYDTLLRNLAGSLKACLAPPQ